ncbi:MAG: amidohydrolase [Acidimicrobiales bacterium]|nr:amidohydrolase [Acidimicrobiales bacterium]
MPPPASPVVRETIRRTNRSADDLARRLGIGRRQFLQSLCGSALTLLTLNACSSEARQAAGPGTTSLASTTPGGTFALPATSTTEAPVASTILDGDEFVMDVQAHLLEYDLVPDATWDGSPFLGLQFPQQNCGEADPRACFSIEQFLDLYFLQSDTSIAVLSAIPVISDDNPLSPEVMATTRAIAEELCGTGRVLAQGQAMPNWGEPAAALEAMSVLAGTYDLGAWKVYTHLPTGFRLDDGDPDAPAIGQAFIDHVRETGPPIICVHKGFSGFGGDGTVYADPADIGPAAARNPDVDFVVYHSGFESSVPEGPYDPDGRGGDRLIRSATDAGVGPGQNVWAELGSTWRFVMSNPDQAAHVLGKLLVAFGPDNVVWGTDSIWYGSPQDQIQAFRAFQITEAFQELHGYPALTDEIKAKILGLNSARLYGVDPVHQPCVFDRDALREIRAQSSLVPASYGPHTAQDALAVIRDHIV